MTATGCGWLDAVEICSEPEVCCDVCGATGSGALVDGQTASQPASSSPETIKTTGTATFFETTHCWRQTRPFRMLLLNPIMPNLPPRSFQTLTLPRPKSDLITRPKAAHACQTQHLNRCSAPGHAPTQPRKPDQIASQQPLYSSTTFSFLLQNTRKSQEIT